MQASGRSIIFTGIAFLIGMCICWWGIANSSRFSEETGVGYKEPPSKISFKMPKLVNFQIPVSSGAAPQINYNSGYQAPPQEAQPRSVPNPAPQPVPQPQYSNPAPQPTPQPVQPPPQNYQGGSSGYSRINVDEARRFIIAGVDYVRTYVPSYASLLNYDNAGWESASNLASNLPLQVFSVNQSEIPGVCEDPRTWACTKLYREAASYRPIRAEIYVSNNPPYNYAQIGESTLCHELSHLVLGILEDKTGGLGGEGEGSYTHQLESYCLSDFNVSN